MNNSVLYIVTLFLASLGFDTHSQNLVPNPSFEDYTDCPYSDNQVHFAEPWTNPGALTPDFFHTCSNNFTSSIVGVPDNFVGYQMSKTGDGYAGIYCFDNEEQGSEYIQVELIDTLKTDQLYEVKFYAVLSKGSKYAINSLSLYFSEEEVSSMDISFPYFNPQITANNFITSKDEWVEVKGCYRAKGDEKFIIIGNFNHNSDTEYEEVVDGQSMFSKFSYYYIDDVSIEAIDDSLACLLNYELVVPNVFTPNNDGVNDYFYLKYKNIEELEFVILNRWGNVVFEGKNDDKWDGSNLNGSQLSAGVYFVKVVFVDPKNMETKTKTGYVHLIR